MYTALTGGPRPGSNGMTTIDSSGTQQVDGGGRMDPIILGPPSQTCMNDICDEVQGAV